MTLLDLWVTLRVYQWITVWVWITHHTHWMWRFVTKIWRLTFAVNLVTVAPSKAGLGSGNNSATGWRRPIECLELKVIFRKRATNHRALLRKMTFEDKASYGSSPPRMCLKLGSRGVYIHVWYVYINVNICIHTDMYTFIYADRPTQSIMYIPFQVNRFQKCILLIV